MASGYFPISNESSIDAYLLYCEWNTEASYGSSTSKVTLSVYIKYKLPFTMENGEVVVNIGDRCERFSAMPFSDSNTGNGYSTRLLYSGELQEIEHTSSVPEKIPLSVTLCREGADDLREDGFILLDPIPQIRPVLDSKNVTEITKNSAKLTMHASHPLGIKEYLFSIGDGETKSSTTGEILLEDLLPGTYYAARFQAVANNGRTTPTEVEVFKTNPICMEDIIGTFGVPIEVYENETKPLELQIKYPEDRTKTKQFIGGNPKDAAGNEISEVSSEKLRFVSSNPQVASVTRDGVIQGVSKGTCQIKISAADGGTGSTWITVNVIRSVEYVHIANQKIQLRKNNSKGKSANRTYRVAYSLYPDTANKEKLTFASNEADVADIDEYGVITVKDQIGHATITIKKLSKDNPDGEEMATCTVSVIGEDTGVKAMSAAKALDAAAETALLESEENYNFVWQDLFMLPFGARWDYQIPAAVSENLFYIQNELNSAGVKDLETIDFSGEFGTDIWQICEVLNALERNIDKVNVEIAWVSPYYESHREYQEYAPMRQDINRWIQFCADIKSAIDGNRGNLAIVSIDEPADDSADAPIYRMPLVLCICKDGKEELQYLCLGEEFLTNGNKL